MAIQNGYCTEQELRDQFGDTDTEAPKLPQALLERAINATSRAIDLYCGRRFWQDPADALTTHRYRCDDPYEVDVADFSTTDGLVVAVDSAGDGSYSTLPASAYQVEPLDVDADGGAYAWTRLVAVGGSTFPVDGRRARLRVTARHGWSAIPDGVNQACLIRAAAIFKRREAIFGTVGLNGFGEVRITRKDPDVMDMLHNFIRIKVGAV